MEKLVKNECGVSLDPEGTCITNIISSIHMTFCVLCHCDINYHIRVVVYDQNVGGFVSL